ncbi:carbon storage regulator CsrA [Oceanobacillus jordanicus]|uniref:Translational regulator CsrA n=1 Tax=Oceanobacillus jordanicus TaxID=2867266 RepID=A0AAW5B850_9BACI|nr:carbon storage regulator CsrA [Oceanobacillus jordanicus]MCG3420571.1 carbon storage regulator CsrA [Oceanobacillus jordanicus]
MLVLRRKNNESIQIGEEIEIKVLGIEGDQVKIGIEAPESVDIYRKELYIDTKQQNNEALNISEDLLQLLKKTEKQ